MVNKVSQSFYSIQSVVGTHNIKEKSVIKHTLLSQHNEPHHTWSMEFSLWYTSDLQFCFLNLRQSQFTKQQVKEFWEVKG